MPLSIITSGLKMDVDLFRILNHGKSHFLLGKEIISAEITKLLSTGVIELTDPLGGDFLS